MTTVRLSRVLIPIVGERLEYEIDGETVGEVIERLLTELPALRLHLFAFACEATNISKHNTHVSVVVSNWFLTVFQTFFKRFSNVLQ